MAGILLFITGATGFLLVFVIRHFTQRYLWHNTWVAALLTGGISCGIVFILILMFARLHG